MRLIEAIPVTKGSRLVFVGAGGKSTSMFRLARQALAAGFERVIVSASTHLAISQAKWADHHLVVSEPNQLARIELSNYPGLILITGPANHENRTEGLTFPILEMLKKVATGLASPVLIEGDGSRRRPLKAPASHEPAIPPWANGVVVCAGLSGLGHPLDDVKVHRSELFSTLSGIDLGEPITLEGLASVLSADHGGLRNIPSGARRYALVTQVDTLAQGGLAKRLGKLLEKDFDAVVASDLGSEGDEVLAVYSRTAGVVLAAGGSERMGHPKQLLDWRGKPFVRVCVETALAAGLSPVVVVTGAYEKEVAAVLFGLDVEIVHNADWQNGQGTSVAVAARFLSGLGQISAAMFLLVDQPQIPARLIEALVEAYFEQRLPIVAPLIDQRRGNPVLFDRNTFSDLMNLEGEAGGRQVFSKYRKLMVPWHDSRDGLDVDTEEDYQNLVGG